MVEASPRELHRPVTVLKRAGRIRRVGRRYFPMAPRRKPLMADMSAREADCRQTSGHEGDTCERDIGAAPSALERGMAGRNRAMEEKRAQRDSVCVGTRRDGFVTLCVGKAL